MVWARTAGWVQSPVNLTAKALMIAACTLGSSHQQIVKVNCGDSGIIAAGSQPGSCCGASCWLSCWHTAIAAPYCPHLKLICAYTVKILILDSDFFLVPQLHGNICIVWLFRVLILEKKVCYWTVSQTTFGLITYLLTVLDSTVSIYGGKTRLISKRQEGICPQA